MVEIFIKGRRYRTNAKALYDEETKSVEVLEGTVVSEKVSDFVHRETIVSRRKETTDQNGKVINSILFDNPTAAAQFVCGYSVSGPIAWHVEKHKTLSDWLKENQ